MAGLNYVGNGAWGTGKGAPLNEAEFDGNTYELAQRIADIIASIPAPLNISNITVSGTQMTIYLEDGTFFGPFTLPQLNFRPSVGGTLDVPTDGVYVVGNGDFNRFWNYDGASDVTIDLPATATADMETTFCQVGVGALLFPGSTDVTVLGLSGFLNKTGGSGSVVTVKFITDGVWRLIGRVAEDVTA
jgi:hypothetical protein